jgi:hypothetical protein
VKNQVWRAYFRFAHIVIVLMFNININYYVFLFDVCLLHKIRKQINEYVLLNSKTIKLHMQYENIILNIFY